MSELANNREPIPSTTTFGDLLQRAARGEAIGYTIFSDRLGISYGFCEVGDLIMPESPEDTLIPMSPEEAQDMYDTLLSEAPEELEEVTVSAEPDDEKAQLN